jgi:hypothetical protein
MTGGRVAGMTGLGYRDPDRSGRGEIKEKRRAPVPHITPSTRRG